VAEYLTELPPRDVLERRLHRAVQAARARLTHEEQEKSPISIGFQGNKKESKQI